MCFAAPRCADLPELLQVQMLFVSKYGKEFVSAATELMPDCGVSRQVLWSSNSIPVFLDIHLVVIYLGFYFVVVTLHFYCS